MNTEEEGKALTGVFNMAQAADIQEEECRLPKNIKKPKVLSLW